MTKTVANKRKDKLQYGQISICVSYYDDDGFPTFAFQYGQISISLNRTNI